MHMSKGTSYIYDFKSILQKGLAARFFSERDKMRETNVKLQVLIQGLLKSFPSITLCIPLLCQDEHHGGRAVHVLLTVLFFYRLTCTEGKT